MQDYRLGDLIDLEILQKLADSNYNASSLPMTIVDAADLAILVKSGWPEICTHFHRTHPLSQQRCRQSDRYVTNHLGESEVLQYKCQNGLWHIAIPIIVAGRHLATLFLTQFFFDDERPDREYFVQQGRELGYDLDHYLAAIDAMPVFSAEKVDYIVAYDKALVRFIAEMAERALRERTTRQSLTASEEKYRTLVDNVNIGVYRNTPDGTFLQANPAMAHIFGFDSPDELLALNVNTLYQNPDDRDDFLREVRGQGLVKDREVAMRKGDGTPIWCAITVTAQRDPQGDIVWLDSAMEDITERKRAQEELQRAHDDLEIRVQERTAALEKANELLRVEVDERKRIAQELRKLSERDPLTGILNRRALFDLLRVEVDKAKRHGRPLSLLLFDLDHFKQVNDQFGHNTGDAVLKATADLISADIRLSDIFSRYGGEEFLIVLPETDLAGATTLAEKIRATMEQHNFPVAGRVTVSIGVAALSNGDTETALIKRADDMLYAAKRGGRNRVEGAPTATAPAGR